MSESRATKAENSRLKREAKELAKRNKRNAEAMRKAFGK